ncbi:MAG: hypothetical protein V1835_02615, partial [Candidatus Micrarchaeota archaeon]
MNESIKVLVVMCGSCNARQVWDSQMKHKVCGECSSNVVLKTASPEDLKGVKARVGKAQLIFSNYLVYSLSPEDVEQAIAIKRDRQKQMKEDIEGRKKYATMERMNYSFGIQKKRIMNDGNKQMDK